MKEEKLLTVREVASILGATEKEVLDLAERGLLPAYKIGGVYLRFKHQQVEEYKKQYKPVFSRHIDRPEEDSFADKLRDFLYFNDFYILSSAVIIALLLIILRG